MIRSALVSLERFLLPNACLACTRMVEPGTPDDLVCAVCRSRLRRVPRGCRRCGQPMPPVGPCRLCASWPEVLRQAASAVWLGQEARQIVHHLKYDGYTRLADLVARSITGVIRHPGPARLVPIPLGRRRYRRRGYNQSAAIARALGRRWGLPVDEPLLARTRDARSQTGLTPGERLENVAHAFAARKPRRPREGNGPIILVDDVLTTGATLAAAAAALGRAGWDDVGGVTFARALPFDIRAASGLSRPATHIDVHSLT